MNMKKNKNANNNKNTKTRAVTGSISGSVNKESGKQEEPEKLKEAEMAVGQTPLSESVKEPPNTLTDSPANLQKKPVLAEKTAPQEQEDAGYDFAQNINARLLQKNPVFVRAIVLVPILGAATSLKNGILLSCAMLLTAVLLNLIAYPLYRRVPRSYRFAALFLMAGFSVTPVCMLANFIAPTVAAPCSAYLPLLAVGAMALVEKRHYGKRLGLLRTVFDAGFSALGFTFAAVVFAAIREIVGNGTLYDRALPLANLRCPFMLAPAGAFLLLGVLIALFRKRYDYREDDRGNVK
jgi:Na+-translocating ferredoxin:NAD+ oxidoreductase subunit E